MRAAAILLLAALLTAAGCRSGSVLPAKPIPKPRGGHPLIGLGGEALPVGVVVVKTNAAREEYRVVTAEAAGDDPWRSLADRLYREASGTGILLAYPDERRRPPAPSDPSRRGLRLVFIDGKERVVADRTVTLDWSRTLVDPERPFRYLLVLRPERSVLVPPLAVGTTVSVPAEAKVGVEPEWRPFRDPPPRRIAVNGVPLEVEIADSSEKRALGLMYRHALPEGRGMLFTYSEDDERSFWMINTRIALDVAYLDAGGVIRRICRLEPYDRVGRTSGEPVRMALEVPAGWFKRHGIRAGDRVDLAVAVPE